MIIVPLIVAGVIAAVAGQLVAFLKRHRVPRALGALLVLLLIIAAPIASAIVRVSADLARARGEATAAA